jgi:hypothetical protein
VQTYGLRVLPLLKNLEDIGALKQKQMGAFLGGGGDAGSWAGLRRALKLIVDDVDVANPTDIAYVSSGYAPLSVRLMQSLLLRGPAGGVGELAKVTEIAIEEGEYSSFDAAVQRAAEKGAAPSPAGGKKNIVVYYLGPVTYLEIAALRWLSEQEGFPYRIIIAATSVENGNQILGNLSESTSC